MSGIERLEVYRDDELIKTQDLSGGIIRIGRKSSNDLVLDDLSVSKRHAEITREGGSWYIKDLDSTNGIVVDGVKLKSSPMAAGKSFQVGKFTLKVIEAQEVTEQVPVPRGASKEAFEDLLALFRLNSRFASVINTDELLSTMMDRLLEIFRADRGFVLLGTDVDEGMKTAVRRGIEVTGEDAKTSRTFIRKALETKSVILSTDQEAFPETVEKSIRSILCAPLLDGGEPMGVVYLDSRIISRIFGEQDKQLLQTFCQEVAGAFQAAEERERLRRELSKRQILARHDALREHDFRDIIGTSRPIKDCIRQVEAVAPQDVTVLIQGESGTGKELFAKAIHYSSERRDGPFVAINCMALSPEIIESELFGHEKGAFSGAVSQRIGKLELAEGGTVFLDEIGELNHEVQVKLLRVLEAREIQRVGGNKTIKLNVRLVTATNVDLREAVGKGTFREDLFYRLNVFTLYLPPLRERKEDIPLLVDFFLDDLNDRMRKAVGGVDDEVARALQEYDWPGNIRELRNVVERAMVLTRGETVRSHALPFDLKRSVGVPTDGGASTGGGSLGDASRSLELSGSTSVVLTDDMDMAQAKEALEQRMILDALEATKGNISAAARNLGVQRKTLHRKIEALGIDMRQFGKNREALDRDTIVEALRENRGSISATARALEVPRTTLYRNMEMFGVDPDEIRRELSEGA